MILFVTTAPNDDDLAKALGSCVVRCPVPSDICFWGRSDDGEGLKVAIERKKIGDLAQCISDGRLIHQAQIAKENDIGVFCLIAEGRIRSNPDDGLLEIPVWGINPRTMHRAEIWQPVKPTITYSRFCSYLMSLQYLAGVVAFRSEDVKETATIVKTLCNWFQKPNSEHQSLKIIYKRPHPTVSFVQPSIIRRVASELKGVGWEKSYDIADKFYSIADMVSATEMDWLEVPGIGKKLAASIVSELKGKKDLTND